MTRIGTSQYRYKRPPRKRPKAAPIEGPAVLTVPDRKRRRATPSEAQMARPAANDPTPGVTSGKSSRRPVADVLRDRAVTEGGKAEPARIVTARRPGKRHADVPEKSEEEHRAIGDRADAMMQEFKRQIAEKVRKP